MRDEADRVAALAPLGLHAGEPVRWRRRDGGNWQDGIVIGVEADGSVAVRDRDGAWRSILVERLEAKRPDKRGRLRWQAVAAAAARGSQLSLWESAAPPRKPRRRAAAPLRPSL